MEGKVFLNGEYLFLGKASVSVIDPGVLYGWGIFETMRSYNGKIVYLDRHLLRLKRSSELLNLGFEYSRSRLKKIVKNTVRINGFKDSYVRLTLWKKVTGTGFFVWVKKYKPYHPEKFRRGFYACVCRHKQDDHPLLSQIKTTSRLLFEMAYSEAKRKECDEAVILNNQGYISQGSRSNIFFIKDGELFTPGLECGCLDGVTRRCILDLAKEKNINAYEGNFTLEDLYRADEAFLTNSLAGVMPLVSIDGRCIGEGPSAGLKLTRGFLKKYREILKSG